MFGYVRPATPELRVREHERFRALYCGMCRTLGKNYGFAARCVLSYDFVFLAAILWQAEDSPRVENCRCPLSFSKKRCCTNTNEAMDTAAGCGVILAYHKLRDNVRDEGFFKSLVARTASVGLRRAYKKAVRRYPDFDAAVAERLRELEAIERAGAVRQTADLHADKFARLLAAAADGETDETRRKILAELLYHLGRWIYITDARDDLAEDTAQNRPNALRGSQMSDEDIELTLRHSLNLVSSAFELMPETAWSEIVRNIVFAGLPSVLERVFAGTWQNTRGYKKL